MLFLNNKTGLSSYNCIHWKARNLPRKTFSLSRMYITVKFGNNESILCNPSCAVVNLLSSIKRRTGFKHANILLDLSDENGKKTFLKEIYAEFGVYKIIKNCLVYSIEFGNSMIQSSKINLQIFPLVL